MRVMIVTHEKLKKGSSRYPAAKVWRFGANPGASRQGGAERSRTSLPLRSWPLDRRSGRTSALPYPPSSPRVVYGCILSLQVRSRNKLPKCNVPLSEQLFPTAAPGLAPRRQTFAAGGRDHFARKYRCLDSGGEVQRHAQSQLQAVSTRYVTRHCVRLWRPSSHG